MRDDQVFACLAAIPGVDYRDRPKFDKEKIPGHDWKLRKETFSFQEIVQVVWDLPGGGTNWKSPAAALATFQTTDPLTDVVRRIYQALELPGRPIDYHFALLGAYELLWKNRKKVPGAMPHLERLCLLDINLVEARPKTVRDVSNGEEYAAHVPAFHYLVRIYEQEGFLEDALDIARRAAALDQGEYDLERLQEQVRQLQAENG